MNRARTRTFLAGFSVWSAARLFVPGDVALVFGLLAAAAMWRYGGRLPTAAVVAEERTLARELPIALDVLALSLDAGASWDRAVHHAADCCTGDRAVALLTAAARLAMGAAPAEVWQGAPILGTIGSLVERSFRSGGAVSTVLREHADTVRQGERMRRIAGARRLATTAVMPVTFLGYPAFLLLGLIPTLVSSLLTLVGPVLSTGLVGP